MGYTTGIRMAYCQEVPIVELIDPFREAIARMVTRYCKTPATCRLKKPVTFSKHQVVVLDTFPRRENRAINFRWLVLAPPTIPQILRCPPPRGRPFG